MTNPTPDNIGAADVLAALTPSEGRIIEPSMWDYSRSVARANTTVDVSDDVFLMRQSAMVHCYTHTLRCMDDRPRVALLPADDLEQARATVAALIARNAELEAESKALREAALIFTASAYPVAKEINTRGHEWSEAYLDQALPVGVAVLARTPAPTDIEGAP